MPNYVFDKKATLKNGKVVYPLRLYQFDAKAVEGSPASEVVDDGTRVGSALANIFTALRINSGSRCKCDDLKGFLNQVPTDWIRSHEDDVVEAIADNAKRLGYPPIKVVIRRFLRMAIRREENRKNAQYT